jgi:voltage-gated potassium channel
MNAQISSQRYGRLLVCLLAYLFLSPFIPHSDSNIAPASLLVHGLLTTMLFFAALAVRKNDNQRSIALSVMGVALVFHWLGIFDVVPYSANAGLVLFVFFYALIIYSFTKQLLQSKHVNGGVIMVTLCIYLLLGLLWGACYALLHNLSDGHAFSGVLIDPENLETSTLHIFNYFSMVTLTTLGYGDITPQLPEAASLCQMEAIVGQFYTAVLVAWLVGMYGRPMGKQEQE